VVHLLTLAFTITFSTFLMLFGNWSAVLNCQNAAACLQVEPFRYDALHQYGFNSFLLLYMIFCSSSLMFSCSPTFVDIIIYMYFFIFCLYWCWHFLGFLQSIRDGLEMREFFQDQLNINDEELQSMEWSRVVERIVAVQRILKLCIVKDLNALGTSSFLFSQLHIVSFSFHCCSFTRHNQSDFAHGELHDRFREQKVVRPSHSVECHVSQLLLLQLIPARHV
jgi:hypothetical protein